MNNKRERNIIIISLLILLATWAGIYFFPQFAAGIFTLLMLIFIVSFIALISGLGRK